MGEHAVYARLQGSNMTHPTNRPRYGPRADQIDSNSRRNMDAALLNQGTCAKTMCSSCVQQVTFVLLTRPPVRTTLCANAARAFCVPLASLTRSRAGQTRTAQQGLLRNSFPWRDSSCPLSQASSVWCYAVASGGSVQNSSHYRSKFGMNRSHHKELSLGLALPSTRPPSTLSSKTLA